MERQEGFGSHRSRPAAVMSAYLLLAALAMSPCQAQEWVLGARVGINASRMSFQDETAQSLSLATPGLHVGVLAGRRLTGLVELRGEVLYTEKGFDSNVDAQLKLAYLEVPLLLSLNWPVALSPRVFVGPVLSHEASCRSTRVLGVGELACDDALASVQRRRTDIGLVLGGGVGFGAGPGELSVEVWANQGFRDISKEARPVGHVRNQVLLLSAAYGVRIGAAR